MKNIYFLAFSAFLFLSCGDKKPELQKKVAAVLEEAKGTTDYPDELNVIFEAHGGIAAWKNRHTLYFEMGEGENITKHTVDLDNRKSITETNNYTMGFDGSKTWLVQDSTYMNPDRAKYMHNLMFYFLAMPFVLGDPGISYSPADTLNFEDIKYPGLKITYDAGVGVSDKDEYIVYSDTKTHKMKWLAYTATFGKAQPAGDFSYIKYDKWNEENDILLPTLLQWFEVVDGKPTVVRSEQLFNKVIVSKEITDPKTFEKPENGTYTD